MTDVTTPAVPEKPEPAPKTPKLREGQVQLQSGSIYTPAGA